MTMAAPPPIALEDLDRDELLQLIKARLPFILRPAELWRARWDVLARRALEARERELEAFSAYIAAFAPMDPSSVEQTFVNPLAVRERKRVERERADRAAKRLEAARDQAWDALQASHGRTAA